jgi:hypothetical protein
LPTVAREEGSHKPCHVFERFVKKVKGGGEILVRGEAGKAISPSTDASPAPNPLK